MDTTPDTYSIIVTPDDLGLLLDGLHALEYWDWGTELDLPRCNGQVFLPEDDASCWQRVDIGADEATALEQIRRIRALARRVSSAVDR